MPKLKTNSGTKKRFKRTAAGLLKRRKAFRNHILTKKSTKSKRQKRSPSSVHQRDLLMIRRLLALC